MADYDAQPGRKPPPEPALSPAQLAADELDLHAGLTGVAGMVAGAYTVNDMLCQVAQFAVQSIPGADGAGVTVVRPQDVEDNGDALRIQAWSVTAEFIREIDVIQYEQLNEGPCITCMQTRRPAVSGSLGSDRRWPHFGGRVARMNVHSVLALPLIVGDQVIGAINSYAYDRDAFSEHAVQLGGQHRAPDVPAMLREFPAEREMTEQGELVRGLGVRLQLQRLTPSGELEGAAADLHLDDKAKFFPSDAALAAWRAQAYQGKAAIAYD